MVELRKFNPETGALTPNDTSVLIQRGGEVLGVGMSEGTVRRVSAEVFGRRASRRIPLAEKHLDTDVHQAHPAKVRTIRRVLRNHAALKQHKLPTFLTLRVDESDMTSLYMTDLTRGGRDMVYSTADWLQAPGRKGKFHESVEKISLGNAEQVSQSIAEIYRRTVEEGCEALCSDIYFLIVDTETRIAKVILGDIYDIEFVSPDNEEVIRLNYKGLLDFIQQMNEHLAEENQLSTQHIDQVHEELRKEIEEKRKTARRVSFSAK